MCHGRGRAPDPPGLPAALRGALARTVGLVDFPATAGKVLKMRHDQCSEHVPAVVPQGGRPVRLYLFRGNILTVPADLDPPDEPDVWPLFVDRRKP